MLSRGIRLGSGLRHYHKLFLHSLQLKCPAEFIHVILSAAGRIVGDKAAISVSSSISESFYRNAKFFKAFPFNIITKPTECHSELTVAKELLGKILVHETGLGIVRGVITEVESYMGETDKGSHTYGGRRTERTEPMYHAGGTSYVYLIYADPLARLDLRGLDGPALRHIKFPALHHIHIVIRPARAGCSMRM